MAKGQGRGRPGGNPEFGLKFSFLRNTEAPRNIVFSVRFSEEEMAAIKAVGGDRYRDYCRDVILKSLKLSDAD